MSQTVATVGALAISATLCALCASPAYAQSATAHHSADSVHSQLLGEHNKLGLIQFCFDRGLIEAEAVGLQRQVVAAIPGAGEGGNVEEAAGRRGEIAYVKTQVTLAESAQAQGMTIDTKCRQMVLGLSR